MADPLTYLQQAANDWLIIQTSDSPVESSSDRVVAFAKQQLQELQNATNSGTQPVVLLTEPNPIKFLASFVAACAAGCPIFLGNPNWVEAEWRQVLELTQPDLIWGVLPDRLHGDFQKSRQPLDRGSILIPTGGSSGQIRFAIHTWDTLMASVRGLQQYFQREQINSCCVLPLYHVSGLMQCLRSLTSGGRLAILPFKALESGIKPAFDPSKFFISLVPTQLQRLMHSEALDWLQQFQTVFLGGAPAWTELLEQARQHQIRLALTYGMTETASQVVTLKPEEFLQGNHSSGQVLPHAEVAIQNDLGESLEANQIGKVVIRSQSLALGYYLDRCFEDGYLAGDDVGYFDRQGYLYIVGRSSHKIITGGENVFPAEVEAAIRSSGLVSDVCVIGLPDCEWGEIITAVYVPVCSTVSVPILQQAIEQTLSKFKWPKRWIALNKLPRNAQGKIDYQQLKRLLLTDSTEF